MIASIDARLAYRIARKRLTDPNGIFKISPARMKSEVICSQSYLRLEVPLRKQITAYQFPVTITQQHPGGEPVSIWENRLQLQDSFFVNHIGYFFQVRKTNGSVPSAEESYNSQLFTYPTSKDQNCTQSFYANETTNLWAGKLSLTIMNRVQTPGWDCYRHYVVPQTQSPFYTAPPPDGNIQQDEIDLGQDGFYPCEPYWTLVGSKSNLLTLELPQPPGVGIEADNAATEFVGEYRMVLILRGILAQNSTTVK